MEYFFRDKEPKDIKLDFGDFQLLGHSIAGIETVYSVPQFDLTLDTGCAPHYAISNKHLALSHWHLDHAGGLTAILGLRKIYNQGELRIIVPDEKVEQTIEFLNLLKRISESGLEFSVHPASATHSLKPDLKMTGIPAKHCTTASGYLVTREKHKLKPKFQGFSHDEILHLKNQKIAITDEKREPLLAYSGDSEIDFVHTEARLAKILIMECSFFADDADFAKIKNYGHAHINDWVKVQDLIESEHIIMTHTSQRHSLKEIRAICERKLSSQFFKKLILFR
ncbi:MAG: hypothetical protein H7A33_04650 [Deltaproteobacteria bacterium]|nr:hypothetical protein [Deltaproteobacteria bacterium]